MDPKLFNLESIVGNLGISPDLSRQAVNSPGANTKQKNKLKKGNQIVININGVPGEKRQLKQSKTAGTYKNGFHAVFLDNNQIYFGKLQRYDENDKFITLKNVYYLQNIYDQVVLNFDLVKLGSEIHSPEDKMHINVDRVLFWEKLQDEGPIVTAILNHKGN